MVLHMKFKIIRGRSNTHCTTGKIKHTTILSAEYVRDQMKDYTLDIYRCKFCTGFHLGHRKKSKIKKKTKADALHKKNLKNLLVSLFDNETSKIDIHISENDYDILVMECLMKCVGYYSDYMVYELTDRGKNIFKKLV